MKKLKYTYWKEDEFYIGYLNDYPDYMTQAFSKEELIENIVDLARDIESETVPYIRKEEEIILE